ncbi:MAG: HK97 family phage prohead protease [Planctomycetaceae bacterium]
MNKQSENYEIRVMPAEVRADGDTITGLIPYNVLSQDLGGFQERILPSAFRPALGSESEVWSLFQHDQEKVMGRRSTGTLKLTDSPEGLQIEISPSQTSWSRDALEVIRHGDSDGFSFGFWVLDDNWTKTGDTIVRDLVSVQLGEVSVVYQPAYLSGAKISVRALEQVKRQTVNHTARNERQILHKMQHLKSLL